ncbi:MAG: response regulator [Candidatus Falkowbacteria bacterium]|nr:response regulator [Candidatus Falkowbacteria bacterium]
MLAATNNGQEENKKKAKVLIAEDDKFLSKVLSDKFTRKNYLAIVASDGVEAINKIKTEAPDIVLLDLIMPNKSGFEILEEVKTDDRYKDIPIIILSNLGQKTDVERGKKLGVADYLIKSNTPINDIVKKVEEVLAQSKIAKG